MEFKLSVCILVLVVGAIQGKTMKVPTEHCFKEANITDPELKEQARNNNTFSIPGKNCYIKCLWVSVDMVTNDGIIIPKSFERTMFVEDVGGLIIKCQEEAKKKTSEGPCEVFNAGYRCISKKMWKQ